MKKSSIAEAKKMASGQVKVYGFARNIRVLKGLIFIDLADSSAHIQLVIEESQSAIFEIAKNLNLETYLEVSGELRAKPAKKGSTEQDFELAVSELIVVSPALEQLPIPVLDKADNEADFDHSLDWRFLDLRKEKNLLIFKVWTELERGFREYFLANNYLQIYPPTFMSTSSETGADVFEVKYFDKKAYLAQSPQFYKQMAMAAGFNKVFMVSPVYRAEKSFTNRHVTEFTGWDAEIADIDSHVDIMDEEENLLVSGFTAVKNNLEIDLEIPSQPFPRITLAEAKQKLAKAGISSEASDDFSPEEERGISEIIKKETGHDFVFITEYPISARPFYHMRHSEHPELTKSFDLLYRGVEITTGAQREHRLDILKKQAIEKNMNLEELEDYLNFFSCGIPAHGGIGMGPARIVMKILNLNNVKEAIFLPRDVKRLRP